ncbi:MAG: NAD(P)H-hydrate dehydratase [Pseudomonadota bacterium]|nr:NAD(P)H-hydrate dehydratase [Pseudomonadota bacterium]
MDDAFLRAWPLPCPSDDSDKEQRGRVLVIGGSREMPGAVILAATAALRAGAGKLTVASAESVAGLIGTVLPESRVVGLVETRLGGLKYRRSDALADEFDAVLIGPGMRDEEATAALAAATIRKFSSAALVLDAYAMSVVGRAKMRSGARVLLTPHAGELAHLTGVSKEGVVADPIRAAVNAAKAYNATIALKGATTIIATPQRRVWRHEGGGAGLATSGSGDTLAGLTAGFAARGASLEQAAVWGVAVHARAGERLATRIGPLGFLAREIAVEVPRLLNDLRPSD